MSAARSSPAPILVYTPSKQYNCAASAGTKLPICAKRRSDEVSWLRRNWVPQPFASFHLCNSAFHSFHYIFATALSSCFVSSSRQRFLLVSLHRPTALSSVSFHLRDSGFFYKIRNINVATALSLTRLAFFLGRRKDSQFFAANKMRVLRGKMRVLLGAVAMINASFFLEGEGAVADYNASLVKESAVANRMRVHHRKMRVLLKALSRRS